MRQAERPCPLPLRTLEVRVGAARRPPTLEHRLPAQPLFPGGAIPVRAAPGFALSPLSAAGKGTDLSTQ